MKKLTFVGGQLFWDMFLAYKIAWIMGRFGAGKTLLAAAMAARLLAEVRVARVVSNIPLSFKSELNKDSPYYNDLQSSAILMDEAWIYLEDRQSVFDYAGFVRKFNHYLLLPSVFPIHNRLSFFYVQRVFNAYTLGFPFWVYKWNINNKGIKEHGYFAIQYPTAIFGAYSTKYVPGDDGNISDAVTRTAKLHGFKGSRRTQGKKEKNDDTSEDAVIMEDVAAQIEDSKDDFQRIVKAFQRGRR